MDDGVNRFAKELADAIAAAVPRTPGSKPAAPRRGKRFRHASHSEGGPPAACAEGV
jgi:hypothetical protein